MVMCTRLREYATLIVGVVLGFSFSSVMYIDTRVEKGPWNGESSSFRFQINQGSKIHIVGVPKPRNFHDDFSAKEINGVPRIFCWVSTHPPNHRTKAAAVRDTWGQRCDQILFVSNEDGKKCGHYS